jgi:hypothetical protein
MAISAKKWGALIHNSETWLSPECHSIEPPYLPFQNGLWSQFGSKKAGATKGNSVLIGIRPPIPALNLTLLKWLCEATAAIGHGRQLVFK